MDAVKHFGVEFDGYRGIRSIQETWKISMRVNKQRFSEAFARQLKEVSFPFGKHVLVTCEHFAGSLTLVTVTYEWTVNADLVQDSEAIEGVLAELVSDITDAKMQRDLLSLVDRE